MKKIRFKLLSFMCLFAGIWSANLDVKAEEQEVIIEMDADEKSERIEDYTIFSDEDIYEDEIESVAGKCYGIYLHESFIGSHHNYGCSIEIPFDFYCHEYKANNGSVWYINIYNSYKNRIASDWGLFSHEEEGMYTGIMTYKAKHAGEYAVPGVYYVECYTAEDESTKGVFYEFYIDDTGLKYTSYQGYDFYKYADGTVRCYQASTGLPVINQFKCDGTYTYYFQADGTSMRDRLTYHPDGVHVIYFDSDGHEVFSDFAHVKRSISGDEVDDYCFFDVNGYLYVDVVTYDKEGKELYYANPYGVLERGKWFQFSDTVMCADGTPWNGAAGNYGYANSDGTLLVNAWTRDWQGRRCYMQANGVALY